MERERERKREIGRCTRKEQGAEHNRRRTKSIQWEKAKKGPSRDMVSSSCPVPMMLGSQFGHSTACDTSMQQGSADQFLVREGKEGRGLTMQAIILQEMSRIMDWVRMVNRA